MRFLLIDKVTDIEKGRWIRGVKNFSLSEEFLRGHFSKAPIVPGSIFIEIMAQLVGLLIVFSHDFKCTPVMSLIEGVRVPPAMQPGFVATIHGEIISTSESDSLGKAHVIVQGENIASLDRIIYKHIHGIDTGAMAEGLKSAGSPSKKQQLNGEGDEWLK